MNIASRVLVCFFLALAFTGCNLNRETTSTPAPINLGSRVQAAAPTPTTATPSPTAAPSPQATDDRCSLNERQSARRINADVQIDYAAKSVTVAQRVRFIHRGDKPLNTIVLDVQANQWEDSFWLDALQLNGDPIDYALTRNRLDITLPSPLAPGCWLELSLQFRLQPPQIGAGLRAYRGFYGYSPRQLNLGHFLPTVAARVAGEWRIHEPFGIGEQIVYQPSDWDVHITVTEAADSLQLAAPGTVTEAGELRWRVLLADSRDLAISLSEDFLVTRQEIPGGPGVAVYSFADAHVYEDGRQLDGAAHTASESAKALALFDSQFGAYPREQLVVVQGDFPDGMEFTGLVFVGTAWFLNFDGSPKNYLTLITAHEIAHQWWYARVGSDSALTPWLDEALATYSEYLFIEAYYPAERNWWWTFRVANFQPQGAVDSAVYEFRTAREYINAIYLRGVQMLHNLREDIGDVAFFDLLRAYRQAGDGRIADPALFWGQLSAAQLDLTAATREQFFREPAIPADA